MPRIPKDAVRGIDVNKMLSGTLVQAAGGSTSKPQGKNQDPYSSMVFCACGKRDPQFKGYCGDCVKLLKEQFDRELAQFKEVSEEYDEYTGIDQNLAEEKLRLMKRKIEQYEIKLSDNQMVNVLEQHEALSKNEENRTFTEFRVTVQS